MKKPAIAVLSTPRQTCKPTEHAFGKFDEGTLFCQNCGETRAVQPHFHGGGTYFFPYIAPYVPYPPAPRWVPNVPTWTISGPTINGTATMSSAADVTSFVIGDPPANS